MGQFSILEGNHEFIGNNPQIMREGYKMLKDMIEKDNKIIVILFLWQGRLFYGGMILYFVWHLHGMYQATQ